MREPPNAESAHHSAGDDEPLPLDPDVEVDDVPVRAGSRPTHLRWGPIALVAFGGALGTGAREAVALGLPPTGPVSAFWPVLLVNITGAFALGLLLEVLLRRGPDDGLRRSLRLLVGTGFMGGYTTYSALAVGAGQAVTAGQPALGLLYAVVSVVAGAGAAFAGVATGSRLHALRGPARGNGS